MALKLGLGLGYWGAQPHPDFVEKAQAAEAAGFDSVWTAEAWGSDCFTPLAWIGANTSRIKLGTHITQISARTPTATAMHALTLDHLSKGRMILGLGASGPQVVEGWYGQPYGKPLSRTREYVDIVRQVLRREAPVTSAGPHYPLPFTGEGAWGMGKPLRPITHPLRADLPIYLGAVGEKSVAFGAEHCDGWLPLWFAPSKPEMYKDALAKAGPDFEICVSASVVITEDKQAALQTLKPNIGFYVGGMGSRDVNWSKQIMTLMGYGAEAQQIQDLFFDGKRAEAIAAVPDSLIDEIAIVGSEAEVRDKLQMWGESRVTTLMVHGDATLMRQLAELVAG